MTGLPLLPAAIAAALILSGGAACAEVQKLLNPCGSQQLCPYYQLVLTPPGGWVIDQEATEKNKVQMLVPKGKNFATAAALIYVQVFYHRDREQPLVDFARASNERWLADVKNAKIAALPPVERSNGKAAFLRFAFENPDNPQQAYEVGAFGVDADKDGNEFILDVVMSGHAKKDLDRAEADYVAFLKAN